MPTGEGANRTTIRYLEPAEVRIFRTDGALHPRFEILEDRVVLSAIFKSAFPLSEPTEYISVQGGDGVEIGVLRTLTGLDPDSREVIGEELDRRYFTPSIRAIEYLRMEAGMWKFVVETQRGRAEFFVRNWRDSAHEIAPGRWQILSVDGGRFEIADLDKFDARSQKLMEQLL